MHLEYKFDTKAIQNKFRKLSELGKADGLTRKIAGVLPRPLDVDLTSSFFGIMVNPFLNT